MSTVNLQIDQSIIKPLVDAKIKEAVTAALGGADHLISELASNIMMQKVNQNGQVSNYSSENKYNWIDIVVTKQINKACEEAIKEVVANQAEGIKESIIKILQTKKGASLAAQALVDSLNGTFSKHWNSSIKIDLIPARTD